MFVELEFKSPLLIGGKKHSSSFIESEDVIRGSVVRAAFAKRILTLCEAKDNGPEDVDGIKKLNWVYFRDKEVCKSCKVNNVCRNFSNIKFSYFYPKGTEVIPLTAMICKTYSDHGFIDSLIDDRSKGCAKVNCGSRLEFITGLRTNFGAKVPYSVSKSISVKNSINPYTNTSKDGMLYSIENIISTGKSEKTGENELIYEGRIDGINANEIGIFRRLRVGGDTTVGLGKCNVRIFESNKRSITLEEVKSFSDKYLNKEKGKNYIAIKFIGDCKIDFNFKGEYLSTEELKGLWKRILKIPESIDVEKVYTEIKNFRGYDASKVSNDKREDAILLISKGTVVVFSSKNDIEELYSYFKNEICSFGIEKENGFGEFEIYVGR